MISERDWNDHDLKDSTMDGKSSLNRVKRTVKRLHADMVRRDSQKSMRSAKLGRGFPKTTGTKPEQSDHIDSFRI